MPAKKPLEWTRRAARDVVAIEAYLAAYNPAAAEKVVTRLLNAALSLSSYPSIGRPGVLPRSRELVVSDYLIIYRNQAKRVLISRVVHRSRQFPSR